MSAIAPNAPCIIGVARKTWHRDDVGPEGAPEPLDMWEHVARAAAADAGRPDAITAIDGCNLVYSQTWQYDDAVQRLADRLRADPKQRHYSGIGGTMGQQLMNATATRMLAGEQDLVLIASAEALATQRAYKKRGERAPYSFKPAEKRPFPWESAPDPIEVAHEIFQAWLTFAIFDNARRGHLGTDLDTYRADLGRMMAPMSATAASNPDAWFPIARSAEEIATADRRQPHGRLSVHEVHGRGDGRRHGRGAARLHPRTRRRPRHPARAARVPARLVLRDRSGARRRPPADVALACDGRGRVERARRLRASASTTPRTSTSTRASGARCTSRAMRSGSRRTTRVG